jgi:hypothetical protein
MSVPLTSGMFLKKRTFGRAWAIEITGLFYSEKCQ